MNLEIDCIFAFLMQEMIIGLILSDSRSLYEINKNLCEHKTLGSIDVYYVGPEQRKDRCILLQIISKIKKHRIN